MLFHEVSGRKQFPRAEGRGSTYQFFKMAPTGRIFALVWDEDIDTRVLGRIDALIACGVDEFDIIGERKGSLTLGYSDKRIAPAPALVSWAASDSIEGDSWSVNIEKISSPRFAECIAHPPMSEDGLALIIFELKELRKAARGGGQ